MAHTNRSIPRTTRRTRRRRALAGASAVLLIGLGTAGTALATSSDEADGTDGTPCSAAARACVDLENHQAWLMEDGRVTLGPVEVSHGGQGTETPTGDFEVYAKEKDHYSAEYDGAPMPWSVFFAPGGIAFHEGDRDAASAGCVRLKSKDATVFFGNLSMHDRVEVR
ncbi:L,D-transpeptidase [Pseudonocardia parietis]|uniref:Lipoprotein-anchoring transpeptidase ErfK/SrfK n=1 Tax=Pseudonocardia parietis TaxID=570936 RepID=A0ABS4VXY2_9PSEU|nr:L,D-transpeptidase [Pseudonocardia parietis]MBP2368803.1 lipoprotein-anchoring transpeptidase ErfK/SrfK [Pseudonocardia parietis]